MQSNQNPPTGEQPGPGASMDVITRSLEKFEPAATEMPEARNFFRDLNRAEEVVAVEAFMEREYLADQLTRPWLSDAYKQEVEAEQAKLNLREFRYTQGLDAYEAEYYEAATQTCVNVLNGFVDKKLMAKYGIGINRDRTAPRETEIRVEEQGIRSTALGHLTILKQNLINGRINKTRRPNA